MTPLLRFALPAAGGVLLAGCAAHGRQVREFETGRETTYFREQAARAAAPATPAPDLLAGIREAAASLAELKDAWSRRAGARDELEGQVDLADPAVKAAFDAGADAAATEALLSRGALGLAALRGLVAARSPAVREARESWRAAVERLDQSQWLEEVAASYRAFARDLDTRVGGGPGAPRSMLREFFPWPAATALRGEMAGLEIAMAREKARAAVRDALAAAEDAFAAALESEGRAHLLAGFVPLLRNMAEVAVSRYASGKGTLDEALRVETEIRMTESSAETARQQRIEAEARLNSLLDRAVGSALPDLADPPLPAAPPPADRLVALAAERSPMVGMAVRAADMARVSIRMAEIMAHPLPASAARLDRGMGIEAGAGRGSMDAADGSGAPRPDAPAWTGVEEAYLRELRLRASAADAALVAARRDAEAMAREAWRMLDTALRDLGVAEGTAVPLAGQAFEVSVRDYQTGAVGFAEHLEAWGALVRARLEALDMRRMALEGIAGARRASGTDPAEAGR